MAAKFHYVIAITRQGIVTCHNAPEAGSPAAGALTPARADLTPWPVDSTPSEIANHHQSLVRSYSLIQLLMNESILAYRAWELSALRSSQLAFP
jgi:hypothetical protein